MIIKGAFIFKIFFFRLCVLTALFLVLALPKLIAGEVPDPGVDYRGYEETAEAPERVVAQAFNPWHLDKDFAVATKYDGNINNDQSGEKDLISVFSPSLRLYRSSGKVKLDLKYSPSYRSFFDHSEKNSLDHGIAGRVLCEHERWGFKAANQFLYSTLPATSEQTGHIKTVTGSSFFEGSYDLTRKVVLALVYQPRFITYTQSEYKQNSYYENHIGPRLYYKMFSKLDVYVSIDRDITVYPSGTHDSDGYVAYLGARGKITPKSVLNIENGVKEKSFDNGSITNYKGFWSQGVLKYTLGHRTMCSLSLKRDIQMSGYLDTGYYETLSFSPSLTYKLTPRISMDYGMNWRRNSYPTVTTEALSGGISQKREDDIYGYSLTFQYNMKKYITLSLGYSSQERDSNFDHYDYRKWTLSSGINIKF